MLPPYLMVLQNISMCYPCPCRVCFICYRHIRGVFGFVVLLNKCHLLPPFTSGSVSYFSAKKFLLHACSCMFSLLATRVLIYAKYACTSSKSRSRRRVCHNYSSQFAPLLSCIWAGPSGFFYINYRSRLLFGQS